MMKSLTYMIFGAAVGLFVVASCIWLLGTFLESSGTLLYRSEADQQRNLNIALALTAVAAALGGWIGWRIAKGGRGPARRDRRP